MNETKSDLRLKDCNLDDLADQCVARSDDQSAVIRETARKWFRTIFTTCKLSVWVTGSNREEDADRGLPTPTLVSVWEWPNGLFGCTSIVRMRNEYQLQVDDNRVWLSVQDMTFDLEEASAGAAAFFFSTCSPSNNKDAREHVCCTIPNTRVSIRASDVWKCFQSLAFIAANLPVPTA